MQLGRLRREVRHAWHDMIHETRRGPVGRLVCRAWRPSYCCDPAQSLTLALESS